MFKHRLPLQWLLFFSSISTTIYHTSCMEQAIHTTSLVTEKVDSAPFLFRLFGLPAQFNQLPKDVQYEIVKKLPTPFKPIRPKPIEIIHNELHWNNSPMVVFSNDGTIFAVCASHMSPDGSWGAKLCIDTLENPHPSADLITGGSIRHMAFNMDGTQLFLLARDAELLTLQGTVIAQRRMFPMDNAYGEAEGICALSDGTFLIAYSSREIIVIDPATGTITTLSNCGPRKYRVGSIHPHEHNPLVTYSEMYEPSLTPDVFDVKTKTWSTLPEIVAGTNQIKVWYICYNSDRSLLATAAERDVDAVSLWDMTQKIPQAVRSLPGTSCLCFRPDSSYALVDYAHWGKKASVRLCSLNTGAYVVNMPFKMGTNRDNYRFSPKGDAIVSWGEHGLRVWKWNPLWDESASFFEKPTLIEQYLFIKYLHQLGRYGLTLNDEGVCAREIYKKRFTKIISLTKQDLKELKGVFLSFGPLVQKYLRLKYQLLAW